MHSQPDPARPGKNDFFDTFARKTTAMRFTPEDAPRLELLRQRLGDLRGQRVVEPGCGAGPLTERLAEWVGAGGCVMAFDPSAGMLDLCRKAIAGKANVQLAQVRCEEASLPERAWDRVICFRVFPHFDDVDAVLARFSRWLKPAGRLHIVHWDGRAALASIHGGCAPLAEDVLPPPEELAAALARHGFAIAAAIDNAEEIYLEAVLG